jgi:hypothetical protein
MLESSVFVAWCFGNFGCASCSFFSYWTSDLPAVGVMAVFFSLQYYLGLVVAYRKKALSVISTKRTTFMEKILWTIKLIKIYGWEASFFQNILTIRLEEKKTSANIYQSIIYGLIFSLPPIVLCLEQETSHVWFRGKISRSRIESLVVTGNPKNIPADAFHLVLHQIFLCPMPEQPISCHSVEVTILGKGVMLPGYEKTYFSVYIIRNWIVKNCAVISRNHHVLSTWQSIAVDHI